eukprot:PhM_4_TR16026/c0_g1_i1/m.50374
MDPPQPPPDNSDKSCQGCANHAFEPINDNVTITPEQLRQYLSDTVRLAKCGNPIAGRRYLRAYQLAMATPSLADEMSWTRRDLAWLLISASRIFLAARMYNDANLTLLIAYKHHEEDCVGNAMFHLCLGMLKFDIMSAEDATDELSRALLCAGPKLFSHEESPYYDYIIQKVPPPEGAKSWDSVKTLGCVVDKLNDAGEYFKGVFEEKFGCPGPYTPGQRL